MKRQDKQGRARLQAGRREGRIIHHQQRLYQVKLAAGTHLRGCFALRYRTRQVLLIVFEYHMRAGLVTDATLTMTFEVPGSIWHADQGKQYGARQTRQFLLQKGFALSMSRAGTPMDAGYAERFVGVLKLAVADRRPYQTLGEFLRAAEAWINFYHLERPDEGLITSLHFNMFSNMGWRIFLHSPYGDVYFSRDWTKGFGMISHHAELS